MRLLRALRLNDGEIVAFVGAGGKTTAMFRLAEDLIEAGGCVITTTTTHMSMAQVTHAPRHFSAFEANRALVAAALEKHRHVLITGPSDRVLDRASSVSDGLIQDLRLIPDVAAVLVEADGARMLPFKAPASHEPAIPTVATLVVPVAGLDVLGQPLSDANVHRPERVAQLTGAALGDPVTPEMIARVLAHPDGGLKAAPTGARVGVLLNKAETPAAMEAGREIAARLLRAERIESVLIGAARKPDAVREVHGRVAAIVLAAGRSSRMGRPKQLLPWGGTTMLVEVVRRLRRTSVADIVVVTGAEREAVEVSLRDEAHADPRVRCVFNPDFTDCEMSCSLQVGLRALTQDRLAALTVLADQPHIEPGVVEAVIQRWRETLAGAVAPFFDGRRGHPLLFDRALWPRIMALPADANPRQALRAAESLERVDVDTDSILRDIDTPDDYAHQSSVSDPSR